MTDAQKANLLVLLRSYFQEHSEILPSPREMSVSELAGDLLELLPPGIDRLPDLSILDPRPLLHRPGPPRPIPGQVDLEGNEAA